MRDNEKRIKGVVCCYIATRKPASLEDAVQIAVKKWGDRVSSQVLTEWVTNHWNKRTTSQRVMSSASSRQITLSDLKVAAHLQRLISSARMNETDLQALVQCMETLGGFSRAMHVITELQYLKGDNFALPGF